MKRQIVEAIHDCPISNHLAGASLNSKQQSCRDLSSDQFGNRTETRAFRARGLRTSGEHRLLVRYRTDSPWPTCPFRQPAEKLIVPSWQGIPAQREESSASCRRQQAGSLCSPEARSANHFH